ncbi:MAG TPA: CehA/McbA family metallohydrolase, partial [Thermoanaerobaculia bacterium]|nr:CehA/McbA family metallohydrolase [Thermoanaerobaculia bacterium]
MFALSGAAEPHWFRGNLHTHTTESDGDSPPAEVVRWYGEHGYDFLVISDHNKVTAVHDDKLLLIPGEEVTDRFAKKPLHVNAIGVTKVVAPQHGDSIVSTLQHDVDAVRDAGGIAEINHPNFGWAFGADEMKQVNGFTLLEIASGHPLVNMQGGGGVDSAETMWDALLRSGKHVYGVAVDDAHYFHCDAKVND